jgi:uncharacterized protein YecE (DUF72 family)
MKTDQLHVGTSGWSYRHWAKGRFYPRGLKQGQWLEFYSQHFDTTEVNSSFYRPPRENLIERWREITADHFRFAIKLWRQITHQKKLVNCREDLKEFFKVTEDLGSKHGPLLIQLPPSLHFDLQVLENFLKDLRKTAPDNIQRWTVEFRHKSWLCEEAYELLDQYNTAVCLADMPRCPITEPNETNLVYIRRHGPGGSYRERYSQEQIQVDADSIASWLQQDRQVYVYFNNDINGYAIENARELIEAVKKSKKALKK